MIRQGDDRFPLPPLSNRLSNLYWLLRYYGCRDQARRRKLYRQIAERIRLQEAGVDKELVRLLCRSLANPLNWHAAARYQRLACPPVVVTKE